MLEQINEEMPNQKFDSSYVMLEEMYNDPFYPQHLVDKVKKAIESVVSFLEEGTHSDEEIQKRLDEMTVEINGIQDEFYDSDSEIETVARDCIGSTVEYVLCWFGVNIETELAIREREW